MGEYMCESCGRNEQSTELREDPCQEISKSHELYYLCDNCIKDKKSSLDSKN
jgi:hypothetical protein